MEDSELRNKVFELIGNITDTLRDQVCVEKIAYEWGEYPRYWMIDFDLDLMEVYVCDSEDYKMYGAKFSFNGDAITIDFENKKCKKWAIVDFDEGDIPVAAFGMIADSVKNLMNVYCNAKVSSVSDEFSRQIQAEKENADALRKENDDLRAFKNDVETAALNGHRKAAYEKWKSQIGTSTKYVELGENLASYSCEEIDQECKIIFADTHANFSRKDDKKLVGVHLPENEKISDAYGGIMERYGYKPKEK